MSPSFDLQAPDHFTAGAVGPPGQRVFYLQGRQRPTLVTLRCEKEQVRALAAWMAGLLARRPATPPGTSPDLLEPVTAAWTVAFLGADYDEANDRVLVEATELVEDDDEEEGESAREPAVARFRVSRTQAAAFVERARALMKAGRPTCPMCGAPVDPGGHVCPRSNGHALR
jgi:uncharacterized repeat protein (TIGR03847 family)